MAREESSAGVAGTTGVDDRSTVIRETVRELSRLQFGVGLGALLAVVLALPMVVSGYVVQVAFTVLLFVVLGYGWNFLSGFTGYVDFGYAGFVGLGAYTTVIAIVDFGLPWPAALLAAAVVTSLVGTLISAPILRLRGAYFAIAMLSLATAGRLAASSEYLAPVTRGGTGISFFPALGFTGQYYLVVGLALALGYATYRLATSPMGLRLLAIREDETLAAALGVRTTREKILAMLIHTAVAGVGGGVLAFNLSYIDPNTVFAIRYTELPIVMVLFGSLGTVVGPVIGGLAFVVVSELLWSAFPTLHLFFFGAAIVLVVLFLPDGLIEWLKSRGYLPRWRSI